MKHLGKYCLSVFALILVFAAPAAAREISCPRDQVRTEITTPLPDPWWRTPQVGSLVNTRIGEVGGETTLICEYRAYGGTVSVMRHPPENFANCTAHEGGFTCTRRLIATPVPIPVPIPGLTPAPVSSTYRTGSLSIDQTWQADLDEGQVGSGTADIWFRAVTATERYIEPRNGARIGIYSGGPGSSGISKGDCVSTPKSGNRILLASAPVGTYICYVTDQGRHGVFRVNQPVGPSPGTLEIGFTTWE